MGWFQIVMAVISYVVQRSQQAKARRAQEEARRQADLMAAQTRGVLLNAEANDSPLPVVYGRRRVGGITCLKETVGPANEELWKVVALGEGPIQAVQNFYYDGTLATDSRFTGFTSYDAFLGDDSQLASAVLMAVLPGKWTAGHRGRGVAYVYGGFAWNENSWQGEPTITCDVLGRTLYDPRNTVTRFSNNPALEIRDYLTNARYGRGIATTAIDDDSFIAAANFCDERIACPSHAEAVTVAAATDVLTFTAPTIFGMGDGVRFATTAPGGLVAGTTYYYIPLTDSTGKLASSYANALAGTGLDITGGDGTAFELSHVDQARHQLDGVLDTGQTPFDNVGLMLSACRGYLIYSAGQYKLKCDQAEAASGFAFTEDNILGAWKIQLASRRERFNRVTARFFNPARQWQPDFAVFESETYRDEDNGLVLETEINLPFTANAYRALREAQIECRQSRLGIQVRFRATVEALRCEVGDVVAVNHSTPGWTSGYVLELPGTAGSYASTPDSAAVDVVGDIDLRLRMAPTFWVTANNQRLIYKRNIAPSYDFYLAAVGGNLGFFDGTTTYVSTAVPGFADGSVHRVRVVRVASTGVTTFYTSEDGVTWTQLGSAVAGAAGALPSTASIVEIGSEATGTSSMFAGKIYSAEVRNGIDGPVVAKFDPEDYTSPGTTFVSSDTGEIWTLNGAARIAPGKLFRIDALELRPDDEVDVFASEYDDGVYDLDALAEVRTAPVTNLPNPFNVVAPGAPGVVETLYETTGSAGVKALVTVSWSGGDAQAAHFRLEYKAASDSTWTVHPNTPGASVQLTDLAPGTYSFRVKAVNQFGVSSAFSGTTTAEVLGLTAPPSDVAGFSVVASNGFAYASWDLHADLDVKIGGRIEICHAPATSGAGWNHGILLKQLDGNAVVGVLPLVTGTYMAKAIDSTGHYSENAVSFVLTEGTVTGWVTVATQTEAPTFSGTKVNCSVASSKLVLSTGTLFDSVAGNFDSATGNFDAYGGQSTSGTYTFGPLDCTTVAVRRFEADISAESVNNGDDFDEAQGQFDAADGLFDGEAVAINDANATLHARITNDNPAGSPVWSEFFPFHVADFNCRAAQFRLDLEVDTPAHNIRIDTLTVHAKEPA